MKFSNGLYGGKAGKKRKEPKRVFRDVEVQGCVRYKMHYERPRFVAQSENQWAAWTRISERR